MVTQLKIQALKTVKDLTSRSPAALSHFSDRILKYWISEPPTRPPQANALTLNPTTGRSQYQLKGPIVWPRPATPEALSRPHISISGRRHIPKLVNANGIAHLRFKKPQSPFLSRVIRNKISQRERRFDLLYSLESQLIIAQSEDEWDRILFEVCGIPINGQQYGLEEGTWAATVADSRLEVSARLTGSQEKNTEVARRMYGIVEMEKVLAEEGKDAMKHKTPE